MPIADRHAAERKIDMGTHAQTRQDVKPAKESHLRKATKATKPTTAKPAKARQQHSEESIAAKLSGDAGPIGLMPPSFPADYVAGSVMPFFLAGSYIGETPSLPLIDLALTKEGACPVQWWGMLYK